MSTIPTYAVDLLFAAKYVANPPANSSPEFATAALCRLGDAVIAFEQAMPVVGGVMLESQPDPDFESEATGRQLAADALVELQEGSTRQDVAAKFAGYLLADARGEEPEREIIALFRGFLDEMFDLASIKPLIS